MTTTEVSSHGDFFARLEGIYRKSKSLTESWETERAALDAIIPAVVDKIAFNYVLGSPLGVGGSGIVAKVTDRNLGAERALKIARPSPGKELILAKILASETGTLLRLVHPNLIRIFAQGVATHSGRDYPYYIMEFVEGVEDSDEFLGRGGRTQGDLLKTLSGILAAVEYLHSQGTVHMDLKPANVLVTPSGIPVLSDLGFAKQLRTDDGFTFIGGTEGFIHPEARAFVQEVASDPNRLRGEADRKHLETRWDLYGLGKTILVLLARFERGNPGVLTSYARRYLKLLACRLLDGLNTKDELALGLTLTTFGEIKYRSVTQARIDLDKLIGSYNLESRIPELNQYLGDTIQASTYTATPFTKRVREVIEHPTVMRLGSFTQLGLLNLVYPTAHSTRLEHSLGTFSVACRVVLALYNDSLNPLFKQIMDEDDLRAALLAPLLHDIGQFPLAHDIEEAEPATFSHEELGFSILRDPDSSLARLIEQEEGWNVKASRVLAILQASPADMEGTLKDRILHSLISGPIDADKIDYLRRDSRTLGLKYGDGIDFQRLLQTLTVVFRIDDSRTYAALGIHEKGKIPAESIAFARYAMYGQVYWHHGYRSIKAVIQRLVWEALNAADDARTLKSQLEQFVQPAQESTVGQASLFPVSGDLAGAPIGEVCQIQQADLAVLAWLARAAGPVGEYLLDVLKTRSLFKRILVLSSERSRDNKLWKELVSFYHGDSASWQRKLNLQQAFQTRIRHLIEAPQDQQPESAAISPDIRNEFLVDSAKLPLLLIDVPGRGTGDSKLEFIIEEDRRRSKLDEMQTGSCEQSVVWQALQQYFQQSIGKARLFAHPKYSAFLSAALSRQTLEDTLALALKDVGKKKS
ncbi:MAG: protein kinase [Vicinamibacterales bacterium]